MVKARTKIHCHHGLRFIHTYTHPRLRFTFLTPHMHKNQDLVLFSIAVCLPIVGC